MHALYTKETNPCVKHLPYTPLQTECVYCVSILVIHKYKREKQQQLLPTL